MMQETIVNIKSTNEYPIRAAVELLHDGQQLQQRLQAAEVKQHAKLATQPIFTQISTSAFFLYVYFDLFFAVFRFCLRRPKFVFSLWLPFSACAAVIIHFFLRSDVTRGSWDIPA